MKIIGVLLFAIANIIMTSHGLDFLSTIGVMSCCVVGCALIDWSNENET